MKHLMVLYLLTAAGLGTMLPAATRPFFPGDKPIVLHGKVNCPYVPSSGGTIYLQLLVSTPKVILKHRRPMNLSIVLDRSGSMGDERKMDYAKRALYSLVDQLSRNDILSIVIYDDVVEVLRPAQRVGDKREIRRLVERVFPRGSTNLGGGMIEGFEQAVRNVSREYVNRVVLLSDGLANQGITDQRRLQSIARNYSSRRISLTTMGVGLDYNENLMVGLAEYGGGNYYFIESPHSLAHILHREFEAMSTILAQNAVLDIRLGRNIRLKDVIGREWKRHGDSYRIPVGDLYAEDMNEITLELDVPEGYGRVMLASGNLEFEADDNRFSEKPSFETSIEYTANASVVEENRDMETQAKADVAVSTRTVDRAMEALDAGRPDEAKRELSKAREFLQASPAASAEGAGAHIQNQAAEIGSFELMVSDSAEDARRTKKMIQFKNYKTQKQKE